MRQNWAKFLDPSKRPSFEEIVNEIIEAGVKLNDLTNSEIEELNKMKIALAKAKLNLQDK